MSESEKAQAAVMLPILSLHRYWIWADFHKESMLARREKVDRAGGLEQAAQAFDALTALAFFYASLFVVIEGWRELGFEDEEIDGYLASENTDLLRRFRNGVFHFQKDFDDQRFMGFLDDAEEPVDWARGLNSAFSRWFDEWGRKTMGYGPRDIAEWMKAERDAAKAASAESASGMASLLRQKLGGLRRVFSGRT
jgi:hypothetical protein